MNSTYSVLNVFLHECFETHPKTSYAAPNKDRSLTFRGGTGAVRDAGTSLWRAHALTAECQQPPDDSSLAGSCVPHDDSTAPLAAACFTKDLLQTREEPITADKRCLCGDAGDFKQQRFKHDVGLLEWHQSPWTEGEKESDPYKNGSFTQ